LDTSRPSSSSRSAGNMWQSSAAQHRSA
jgi:hypothetical protein